jgi:hypothetical protein
MALTNQVHRTEAQGIMYDVRRGSYSERSSLLRDSKGSRIASVGTGARRVKG